MSNVSVRYCSPNVGISDSCDLAINADVGTIPLVSCRQCALAICSGDVDIGPARIDGTVRSGPTLYRKPTPPQSGAGGGKRFYSYSYKILLLQENIVVRTQRRWTFQPLAYRRAFHHVGSCVTARLQATSRRAVSPQPFPGTSGRRKPAYTLAHDHRGIDCTHHWTCMLWRPDRTIATSVLSRTTHWGMQARVSMNASRSMLEISEMLSIRSCKEDVARK